MRKKKEAILLKNTFFQKNSVQDTERYTSLPLD